MILWEKGKVCPKIPQGKLPLGAKTTPPCEANRVTDASFSRTEPRLKQVKSTDMKMSEYGI